MNAKKSPAARFWAFTLMELMVTITIIAILLTIAIPAGRTVMAIAHRTAAKNSASQLKTAVGTYYTEYRRYPTRLPGPEDASNPILSDHALMDILLASKKETVSGGLAPRGKSVYSDRMAKPMGEGRYKSGLIFDEDGGGTLWDPWGNHFRVIFDMNYDSRIPAPDFVDGTAYLSGGVAIWSAGPDESDDASEDNVVTW